MLRGTFDLNGTTDLIKALAALSTAIAILVRALRGGRRGKDDDEAPRDSDD